MKTVVIVPWFNYWRTKNSVEFGALKKALEKQGYKTYLFDYEERPNDLDDLLKRLDRFLSTIKSDDITLIGFSLGAYISFKYKEKYKNKKIKHILLCIPLVLGSRFFRRIIRFVPYWKSYSGKLIQEAAFNRLDPFKLRSFDIGVIQGKKRINRRIMVSILAQLLLLGKNNDGLFTLDETDFGPFKKKIINVGHYDFPYNKISLKTILDYLSDYQFH